MNDLAYFSRLPDFDSLSRQLPSNIRSEALSTLLDCVINRPEDEESIWTANYNIFTPKTVSKPKITSQSNANSNIVCLYDAWHSPYLMDSLIALQKQMQDCITDCPDYYVKTFVFVQSSGMGKSRLADAFGKNCLMINFILCKDDGYPPGDSKILQFMLSEPPDEVIKLDNKLPSQPNAAVSAPLVKFRRAI